MVIMNIGEVYMDVAVKADTQMVGYEDGCGKSEGTILIICK